MIRKLSLALIWATVVTGSKLGLSEANGGDIHFGPLSGAASLAIGVVGVAIVGLFVAVFVLRWRESARSSSSLSQDSEGDTAPELEGQDER